MEKTTNFLSRAWHDLTSVKGWWQPIAILTLVACIPFVGTLFVTGYLLDWAREGAWGMTRSITRKVGDAGKRLKWGFFAVVISLVWMLPIEIVGNILGVIPFVGVLFNLVCTVLVIFAAVLVNVASVNMSIYDRIKGGLQFKRIFGMAKMDAGGLARCFGISLLALIPVIIGVVVACLVFAPLLFGVVGATATTYAGGPFDYSMFDDAIEYGGLNGSEIAIIMGLIGGMGIGVLLLVVVGLFVSFFCTLCSALAMRSYGYWVGQFKPQYWGGIEDPMPHEPGYHGPNPAAGAQSAYSRVEDATPPSDPKTEPDPSVDEVTFNEVKETAAAAAVAAGAFAKEKAGQVADSVKETAGDVASSVKEAAANLKPEATDADDEVTEVEVVEVEDEAPASKPSHKYCMNCGTEVAEGYKFCPKCGAAQ